MRKIMYKKIITDSYKYYGRKPYGRNQGTIIKYVKMGDFWVNKINNRFPNVLIKKDPENFGVVTKKDIKEIIWLELVWLWLRISDTIRMLLNIGRKKY